VIAHSFIVLIKYPLSLHRYTHTIYHVLHRLIFCQFCLFSWIWWALCAGTFILEKIFFSVWEFNFLETWSSLNVAVLTCCDRHCDCAAATTIV